MAIIEKLHVLKFRNLTDQYLLPNNNINLIIGKNGQGKTNFIESIYYLGHGRSFKTKNLKDIIPFDEQQIKITALVDKQKISIKKSRDKSQALIDEEKISSNSFLSQILPIQIISPDRGFVVGGSPKLKLKGTQEFFLIDFDQNSTKNVAFIGYYGTLSNGFLTYGICPRHFIGLQRLNSGLEGFDFFTITCLVVL
mgnify:CR=1 FL=1